MTIESSEHALDLMDFRVPTQKLVGIAREKYIHKQRYRTRQTTLQIAPSITHSFSVVIVTSNEQQKIKPLLESLQKAFDGVCVEVIFVDDSSDRTPEVIKGAARTMNTAIFQIFLEHRLTGDAHTDELGLAIVHGLYKAQGEHIVVIHLGQVHIRHVLFHAERLRMLYDQAVAQKVDLVIASRA